MTPDRLMKPYLLPLLLLTACGDFTDGGSGSGTLEVDARASYSSDTDRTEIRVDVRVQAGDPDDARVRITDDESNEVLELEVTPNAGLNVARFNGVFSGYRQRLEIEVERGSDDLDGKIEGPGRHVIESPANGTAVSLDDIGNSLEIEWAVEDGLRADSVTVSLDESDFDATVTDDRGDLDVDVEFLELGDEEIEVQRTNSVVLSGGLVGSKFDFSYSVENEFIIVQ